MNTKKSTEWKILWEGHGSVGMKISGRTPYCCWIQQTWGDQQRTGTSVGTLRKRPGPIVGCHATEDEEVVLYVT